MIFEMKIVYRKIIGLLMALPGFGLLYLSYVNRAYDISIKQIVIFSVGALISSIIMISFFYGLWLITLGPEE